MPDSALQQVVCCMGQPVAGNPLQFMMQRAFAAAGLDWVCLTVEVPPADLADAVRGLRAMGFQGANITIPHKVAVTQYLDRLSEHAALMGAVNCVFRDGGQLVGENTDGRGFVQSLAEICDPAGKRVVVLGAGGAARGVAIELGLAHVAELTIVNRTAEHGQALADLVIDNTAAAARSLAWKGTLSVPAGTDILVNATPVGLLDAEAHLPLDPHSLCPPLIVADVVFNPPETWLLREAHQRGCTVLNGIGMLVHQAVIAYQLWTGSVPDLAVMREAVEEFLEI